MKKLYALLFASGLAGMANAEVFTYEDSSLGLTYQLDTETKTAVVTDGKKAAGNVMIPSQVNYESTNSRNGVYKTVAIGEKAFEENNSLSSVVIPEGVVRIENYAFAYSSLTSISLPYGLAEIGDGALDHTDAESFVFPETLTDFDNAFYSGYPVYDITDIQITFDIRNLENWLTRNVSGMESCVKHECINFTFSYELNGSEIRNLLIPMGTERIRDYAFYGCESLTSVTFPDSMKEIGNYVFTGTEGLSEIRLNNGIRTIGDGAFADCPNIEAVILPEGLEKIGKEAFANNTALASVAVPESVTSIGEGVFTGCVDLEKVTLPNGLNLVPAYAFKGCGRLKNVNIPTNVKTIGEEAFYGTTSLLEVKLPDGIKELGVKSFMIDFDQDYAKFDINLPEGLETIAEKALGCRGVRQLTLPSTLKEIGSCAFGMTRVMELNIPASITELGEKALAACPFLTKVTLPSTLKIIGKSAFESSTITGIEIPASVTTIMDNAFSGTGLTSITIPDGVTTLGSNVLSEVENLAYVEIGKGITSLEKPLGAPDNCFVKLGATTPPSLSTSRLGFEPSLVLVPNGAESAYKASNRWKDYRIAGENSTRVNVYVGTAGTLASEIRIQSGKMPAEVTNLVVEGTLNDADFATMRSNMTSCYDINLSKISNTVIPEKAFQNKANLINLTLPSKVKTINDDAFAGCAVMHLTSLPETLVAIGERAFHGCQSMDNDLVFPAGLTTVGSNAFEACRNLKSADFSATSLRSFPVNVFAYCDNLSEVRLPETLTVIPEGAFRNSGVASVNIPANVQSIGNFAFTQCPHLSKVVVPEGVTSIGAGAFLYSGLRSIDLPQSLTEIGTGAFQYSLLAYISFPDNLKDLVYDVVADCSELLVVNLPSKLEAVYDNSLNSASIAAINCPAVTPPATIAGSPFKNIDNYTCALSIPKQSYTPYLLAEYWGSFIGIRNCIDVNISENLDVTYMNEIDYQAMLEGMNSGKNVTGRRKAVKVMQENDVISLTKGYGKLFNGASLYRDDESVIRVFVNYDETKVSGLRITYDGEDYTDRFSRESCSVLIPASSFTADLTISVSNTGVDGVVENGGLYEEAGNEVYNLIGVKVLSNASKAEVEALPAGLYIVNGKKVAISK